LTPRAGGEPDSRLELGKNRFGSQEVRIERVEIVDRHGRAISELEAGEPLATVFAANAVGVAAGRAALRAAIVIDDEAELPLPLVSHRVTADGVEELAAA